MTLTSASSTSLHDFFTENLEILSDVIRHGYQKGAVSIPSLDPYTADTEISEQVSLKKVNMSVKIGQPTLFGLATLKPESSVHLDLAKCSVVIDLHFSKIQLASEDFHLKGDYKLLLLRHNLNSDGSFKMTAKDVQLKVALSLMVSEKSLGVTLVSLECDIGNLDFKLEDSYALSKLLPLFKSRFEALISAVIGSKLADFTNIRLQQACEEHAAVLAKLEGLYKLKKQQGRTEQPPRLLQGLDGIGQLPFPMFWQVPAIDTQTAPKIDLNDLLEEAQTGDLILFAGSYPSSLRIRRLTQSRYSHVVVVIKEPDICDGKACIWQATSSTHQGVLRGMEEKSGIQLNFLADMLRDYRDEDANSVISYRKAVQTGTSSALARDNWSVVKAFIEQMDGKPYTDDMDGLYIMGLMEVDNPKKDDYFCAGLVAETLMKMQLLDTPFMQYQYAPRDFSELQTALPLLHGVKYSAETVIENISD